jgi:hypothetical protein
VKELPFATPPSLSFATTSVGSTSTDSPQTVTVLNDGNAALSFPIPGTGNNPSLSTNFTLNSTSGGTCPLTGSASSTPGALAVGASCTLPIGFAPTVGGSISGSLVLTDTNLNANPSTTQSISLSGTGVLITLSPSTVPAGTVGTAYSQTLTATGGTSPYIYAVTSGALPAGLTLSGSGLLSGTPTAAGSFGFTITATDANNHTGSQAIGLTIGKATATVTLGGLSQTYTGSALVATATTSPAGLTVGFTYGGSATARTAAGSYAVVATVSDPNYTGTASGTLVIGKAAATITANSVQRAYGAANPTFTGSYTGNLGTDSFTAGYSTTATTTSNAGSYAIVPSLTGTNLADYSVTATNGTLTITQAPVTVTVNASSSTVNPNQAITFTTVVASTTTGMPTGQVTFYDNSAANPIGTVTLVNGSASITTSTLAPGITHVVSVNYMGDVNFLANANSSGVTTVVNPPEFTFTPTSATALTVAPGTVATYSFGLAPLFVSYAGAVSFTVTGLPAGATATFTPSTVAIDGSAQTITLSVQTPKPIAQNRAPYPSPFNHSLPLLALILLPVLSSRNKRRKLGTRVLTLIVFSAGLAGAVVLTGCGSGSNGFLLEQPSTYTLTVTATAGNVQHNQTVTLAVQ